MPYPQKICGFCRESAHPRAAIALLCATVSSPSDMEARVAPRSISLPAMSDATSDIACGVAQVSARAVFKNKEPFPGGGGVCNFCKLRTFFKISKFQNTD